ncbi:sugar ABC transporter permease [Nocardioides perillae]|uniref:Arabinogalactan oligomer/maltooligosaccharide transport system permease protein n=1 Tax=Nocardioides perillae TaxID=1119534 RepID=A0A7Y9RUK9_9ACTN|nr:sugar ABC transporter permease [Nocardioides perillae]NYG56605.1 arabinogalactan oligomer/maltooligosaccharide transport system permease protein [Nocardioides perillae]
MSTPTSYPQDLAPEESVDEPDTTGGAGRTTGPPPRGLKGRRWWSEVGWRHVVGVVACLWALFPVAYIVSAAFNPLGTVVSTSLIPRSFSLGNFEELFSSPSVPFGRWALNTLVVCTAVVLVQILFSAFAAYAFSRFRFRGRRGGLLALLLIQMFPQFLAAVALFTLFTDFGEVVPAIGLNTLAGYVLVLSGGALGQVWLIKGFFDSVPRSLDEAAMMDGASHVQTFFRIILPLVRPILAVSGLLVFVATIAEFLLASIFLTETSQKTLATGLYGLIDGDRSNNLGVFAAGALLTAIPVILLFLFLQRYIVGGITAGGVKE